MLPDFWIKPGPQPIQFRRVSRGNVVGPARLLAEPNETCLSDRPITGSCCANWHGFALSITGSPIQRAFPLCLFVSFVVSSFCLSDPGDFARCRRSRRSAPTPYFTPFHPTHTPCHPTLNPGLTSVLPHVTPLPCFLMRKDISRGSCTFFILHYLWLSPSQKPLPQAFLGPNRPKYFTICSPRCQRKLQRFYALFGLRSPVNVHPVSNPKVPEDLHFFA